jgi:hypothetical protein
MSSKKTSPERAHSHEMGVYDATHHGGFHPFVHFPHGATYFIAYIGMKLPEISLRQPSINLHRIKPSSYLNRHAHPSSRPESP